MRRLIRIRSTLSCLASLTLLALTLAAASAGADEKSAAPKSAPPTVAPVAPTAAPTDLVEGEAEAVLPRPRVSPLRPMMVELRAVLDEERRQLDALAVRFKAATDAASALAIQRDIEKLKTETEATLLRVQATHARKAGREALAAQLELAAQDLLAPPKRVEPSSIRPTPEAARSETSR